MRTLTVHARLVAKPRITHKTCTKCGQRKPLESFYRNTRQKRDGRRADCIACFGKRVKLRDAKRRASNRWQWMT